MTKEIQRVSFKRERGTELSSTISVAKSSFDFEVQDRNLQANGNIEGNG